MPVRRQVHRPSLFVSSVAAVALAFIAGCGNSEDSAACSTIVQRLDDIGNGGTQLTTDPVAAGELFTSAANDIRSAANGASDGVKGAASNLTASLEKLGSSMANSTASDSTIPDTTDFVTASKEMRDACD